MIFRLICAAFALGMAAYGVHLIEVKAALMEFGRARDAVVDMGLFLMTAGVVGTIGVASA